jgi:uncharacterized membrane protein YdjX (TVP38/TMEM64 family)
MTRGGVRHFSLLVALLLAAVIVPFLIWGEAFEEVFSMEGARAWMDRMGRWAWLGGILLLVADIVLPVPGTIVMSALGWTYGWLLGGLISAAGSMLSGFTAYGLCRAFGRNAARRIAGADSLEVAEEIFRDKGGWLVAVSRWTPVLPEAVACLAGLARMPWRGFWVALACGSLPLGFAFAAIGHLGQENPVLALTLSAVVPVLLWLVARPLIRTNPSPSTRGQSRDGSIT